LLVACWRQRLGLAHVCALLPCLSGLGEVLEFLSAPRV
jgi:hypothetical protein